MYVEGGIGLRRFGLKAILIILFTNLVLFFQNCSPFGAMGSGNFENQFLNASDGFSGKTIQYQPATIRRLSNLEITNSVQDVFMGGAKLSQNPLPLVTVPDGFDNRIGSLDVSTSFMTSLQTVAELASAYAEKNIDTLITCNRAQSSCISGYINNVGRRAFRRPLTPAEQTEYMNVYNTESIRGLVEAMVQSPNFIYRTELGSSNGQQGIASLTPFETAAALSYFILKSAPDDILLDAAAADQLSSPAQRAAQVKRLLQLPRAQSGVNSIMLQWLQLIDSDAMTGTFSSKFPQFTKTVANSAITETDTFVKREIFNGQAKWKNLFLSSTSYLDQNLAVIYGADFPANTPPFSPIVQNSAERKGLLTQTSFLASRANSGEFSPVHFGKFVATQIFCNAIPPPPPDVPALDPDPTGALTPRQRFANHEKVKVCASCHTMMDPMGWAFEKYNPLGQFQPVQNGVVLTGAGKIVGTDVDGSFTDAPKMSAMIAESAKAQKCFTSKVYEYALGRPAYDQEALSLIVLDSISKSGARFIKSDSDIKDLLGSIAESEAFVKRDAASVPQGDAP